LTLYVIDASVASRFLLIEDLSDKAELVLEAFLRGALDLRAPELVVYEVGNTLWESVKQGIIDFGEAEEKFSCFLELRVDSIKLNVEDAGEALEWGVENDATYYDSVYVEASKKIGATLLTADDILYGKTHKQIPTLHLKDYKK